MAVEDLIERFERFDRRRKLMLAGGLLVMLVILGVGINTIVAGFMGAHPKTGGQTKKATPKPAGAALGNIHEAQFAYLAPDPSEDWTLDESNMAYDTTRGVVKYPVKLNSGGTITVSQQAMPTQLLPRTGDAFNKFINDAKVTRSQDINQGTLYYLPALQNGAPANGADTVIYATDNVLLFGKANTVLGYDKWVKFAQALEEPVR